MANNKLTKSLRNSIAAETKSIDLRSNNAPQARQATSTASAVKPATKAKPASSVKQTVAKKPTKKDVMTKKTVSQASGTKNKQAAATKLKAATPVKANVKRPTKTSSTEKTISSAKLQDNLVARLAHTKLHHIVETNYHLCETCLENLQKVNANWYDYLNQLVQINNVNSLIKLNLSYLSAAPTRYQEMIAQNKNIFSNFFKFASPNE